MDSQGFTIKDIMDLIIVKSAQSELEYEQVNPNKQIDLESQLNKIANFKPGIDHSLTKKRTDR